MSGGLHCDEMALEEAVSMMWGADAWWWGWIMMVTFWAVIVFLVVWAIRSSRSPDDRRDFDRA